MNRFSLLDIAGELKKGDLPSDALVAVYLSAYSTMENGCITVTSNLANDSEIDFEIDSLIRNLEAVRVAAKKAIKKHNEKILPIF